MQQYASPGASSTADPQLGEKKVPFSLDLEQAVLGALIVWNKALDDVSFLEWHHFYDPLHAAIFDGIGDLVAAGKSANPITLANGPLAKAEPVNASTTVLQYLGRISAAAAPRDKLVEYARTVVDLGLRRTLILVAEDMIGDLMDSSHDVRPGAIIEDIEARLFNLGQANAPQSANLLSFKEAASLAVDDAEAAYKGQFAGIATEFVDVDRRLGGLQPSDLIILAGRPSMGKTALATNIAFNVARKGIPVAFFSLEMSAKQLAARVLGASAGIPSSKLRSGAISETDFRRLMERAAELEKLPLFTDQQGGITIAQLSARARRLKRKHGIGLVVVDYLQLMQASKRRENRVQDITEITTGLKALAKELNVPVIALSQLSREVEKRENKRPQLSDLRESGSIEQDADVVLFVYRDEYYKEREATPDIGSAAYNQWQADLARVAGKAEIVIGKQRHGETGIVEISFDGALTRFGNLAKEVRRGL